MASRFDTQVQFNPYIKELPTELLSQVGLSLNQGYMNGVQQVQSTIDHIASLDVVKDQDKQLLRQKLSQMGNDISKLTTEDFRNPLVVGKIGQIASGIASDNAIQNAVLGTKAYRTKKERIDTLRQKNPELYNPNNEAYSMLDINSWLNDGNAGSRLEDNHAYTDYYDYAKEVREVMKDFKPAALKKTLPNGGWIITNEDKSWTDAQLKNYLQGTLSDRAKTQMKIEAVTAFHNNDEGLLSSYVSDLKQTRSLNEKKIKEIDVKCLMENDQSTRQSLNDEIIQLQNQNEEISDHLSNFQKGDISYFKAYKENIASQLFRTAYINQSVRAYAHPDVSLAYAPNSVWQTTHIQNMENARQSARFKFEAGQNQANREQQMDLKMLELGLKYLDKDGKIKGLKSSDTSFIKSQPNVGEGAVVTTGEEKFHENYVSLDKQNANNYELIKQKLLASKSDLNKRYLDFIRKGGKESDISNPAHIAAEEYLKNQLGKPENQRDRWANEYIAEQNRVIVQRKVYDQLKGQIDNKLSAQFGKEYQDIENEYNSLGKIKIPLFDIRKYNRADPTSGDASVSLSADKLKDLFFNKQKNLEWKGGDYFRPVAGYANRNVYDYRINGVEGRIGDRSGWEKQSPQLAKFLSIIKKNTQVQESAAKYRNNLYSQANLNLGDYWTPVSDKDKDAAVKQSINYIQRQLGGDPDEFTVAFVNRTSGEVQFRVNPKKNSTVDPTILKSLGYQYNSANDTYSTGNLSNLYKRDVSDLSPTEKVLVSALDGNSNIPEVGYYTPSSVWDVSGNKQFIQIVKDKGSDGNYRYYLVHENSGTIIDYQDLTDPVSAIHAAKKLTSDLKLLQDVIRKKNPDYIVK